MLQLFFRKDIYCFHNSKLMQSRGSSKLIFKKHLFEKLHSVNRSEWWNFNILLFSGYFKTYLFIYFVLIFLNATLPKSCCIYTHSALTDWFADKLFQSSPLGNSTDVFLDSICSAKSIRKIFFLVISVCINCIHISLKV